MSTKPAKCEHCGGVGEDVVPFGLKTHTLMHLECWYKHSWGEAEPRPQVEMEEEREEMADNFPPSGRLFSNNKKTTPKAPDVTGNLEITQLVLDHLNRCAKAGRPINMELAGWRKQSRTTSGSWYSLSASVPYKDRMEQQQSGSFVPYQEKQQASPAEVDTFDDEIPF
jgi:hypothetical protein